MQAAWKVIGGVIILFAVIIAVYSYKDVIPFYTNSPEQKLESLWKRDIINLIGSKALPEAFFKAKDIKYSYGTPEAREWLSKIEIPLKKNPEGTHRMEVFIDRWAQGTDFGAMIQYQLINLSTNDTEWELGRTLTLGKLSTPAEQSAEASISPTTTLQETSDLEN